jgi:flagellar biosynthetic protein FlhB
VPGGLYLAVAQILAYVFQLKASAGGGPVPGRPATVEVSDEFFQGPGTGTGPERKTDGE